ARAAGVPVACGARRRRGPAAPAKKAKKARAAALFGLDKVHDVHLTIPAKAWDEMQPKNPPRFGFGPPGGGPGGGGAADGPRRGGFGYDFRYVKAEVVIDGKAVKGVGVRFKGNSSYMMAAGGLKGAVKIPFKHHGARQHQLG